MRRRKGPRKNVRYWKGKLQAYIEVDGKPYAHTFELDATNETIDQWLKDQKKAHAPITNPRGSFAADVAEYLTRVKAMPTYKQRAAHLELWLTALGPDRARNTITAAEIDRVMQTWLTTPSRPTRGRPSGPNGIDSQTVRKRRTSLLSLFVKLDGKAAQNPVRGSACPKAKKAEVRGTDYKTIARIFAAIPDYRDTKKGKPREPNLSKRYAEVVAYTGIPPGMLGAVQRHDLHLSARRVRVLARQKGGGVEPRTLELTPAGVAAFRRFDAANAYGRSPAVKNINISFQRGCQRINVTGLTLYDLRHSFGALIYRVTKDDATVGRFLGHAEGSPMTARYRAAANIEVDRSAARKVGRSLSLKPVPKNKPRKQKHLRKAS